MCDHTSCWHEPFILVVLLPAEDAAGTVHVRLLPRAGCGCLLLQDGNPIAHDHVRNVPFEAVWPPGLFANTLRRHVTIQSGVAPATLASINVQSFVSKPATLHHSYTKCLARR